MADPKSDDASRVPPKPTLIDEETGDPISPNSVQVDTGRITLSGQDLSIHTALPIYHDAYNQIGRVVAEWSRFEHELDLIIAEMVGVDHKKLGCVTSQIIGAAYRIEAIKNLTYALGLDENFISDLRKLQTACGGPNAIRNRIVHDPWLLEAGSNTAEQFRNWPKDQFIYGFDEVADLDKFINGVQCLIAEAAAIRAEIQAACSP